MILIASLLIVAVITALIGKNLGNVVSDAVDKECGVDGEAEAPAPARVAGWRVIPSLVGPDVTEKPSGRAIETGPMAVTGSRGSDGNGARGRGRRTAPRLVWGG
jgi:hypothetical protein